MQLRTPQTVGRKRKLRALTYKRKNWLIWEHLDEWNGIAQTFALKVIVSLGINIAQFNRKKQNQNGSHI